MGGHGHDDHGHGDHGAEGHHDHDEPGIAEILGVQPRHYTETRMSRRARPQWDPAELAKGYLDDMEDGGRLHRQRGIPSDS
jgi:hypothetical protein